MAISIANTVSFTNSTDVPKKMVDLNVFDVSTPQHTTQTPASIQSGKDDSNSYLVCTKKNPGQPGNGVGIDVIINFGPGSAGIANAASAYATILAATTAIA